MLSYEEIFTRHARPLSFLDRHLDSPVTFIPKPFIRRTPVAYKEKRRPTSIACLDSLYSYRQKEAAPKTFHDDYMRSSTENIFRLCHETPKENTSRISRYSHSYRIPQEDSLPKVSRNSYRLPSTESSSNFSRDSYRQPLRDSSPSVLKDNYRFRPRDSSPSVLRESHKYAAKENVPRSLSDDHRSAQTCRSPMKETKSRNFSDNYRHAVTFPERHLSRREIPLCTPDELLDIIREPAGYYALPIDPWNEVYPDVYLSDAPTALCTSVLRKIGITHVLNAAQGKEKGCGQVNTSSGFYSQSGIKFLGVPAFDNIVFRIYPYFEEAAEFIDEGLKSKGKVLVHCRAGISRSATLVCAFLMMKRGMTAQEAVKAVRKNREIIPNDGFLQQLCDLNDRLKRK